MRIDTETDLHVLRQKAALLQRENDLLHARLVELTSQLDKLQGGEGAGLQQELALLQEKLAAQATKLFGKSSEKRKTDGAEAAKPERPPQTGHGPRPQPKLPVVEQIHELDDADKVCVNCGGELRLMADQFEESDEIDVVERVFRVVHHKRQKYRCNCQGCIDTALGPPKLVVGGRYSVRFAVEVASDKYSMHKPLTRQCQEMAHQGLVVDSQTLWDQISALAQHLEKAYDALRARVLGRPVVGADETRWPVLDAENKVWWAWSVCSDDGVWYRIAKSRSHEEAGKLLGEFSGTVITDAYGAYQALRNKLIREGKKAFLNPHCWAHSRRKFVAAEPHQPEAAGVLALIGKLYAIEAKAKAEHPHDEAAWQKRLAELRTSESAGVLAEIRTWRAGVRALPKSALGRAISYMDDNWQDLGLFVHDPLVPLDNNDAERGMRRLAVGRKNHYGSKSLRGTEVAAIFYSLIETAHRIGLDPKAYLLAAALAAIADPKAPPLLPHEFAAQQAPPS
jgi:transposase